MHSTMSFFRAAIVSGLVILVISGCIKTEESEDPSTPADSEVRESLSPPLELDCANEMLTAFDGLLVVAPHPDDESLGFGGLIRAYLDEGKPVEVVVTTDGDAYCEACRFWKSGSVKGATCGAEDLSNFATTELDSFAEVRRSETLAAMQILGVENLTFLGYPDTGVAAAWTSLGEGDTRRTLRRSDFSACTDCATCGSGYGQGPETDFTASTLMESLRERISGGSDKTLIATTHRLDGHGDHAALGELVHHINEQLETPRAIASTVIHAHTPKDTSYPDCWYPGPQALDCACAEEERAASDPDYLANSRKRRFRPEWPAALPDDADYGDAVHLCLPEGMFAGEDAIKLKAVESYASQLGFVVRSGELPAELEGIIDCSGYLNSFVRRSEVFVLTQPLARTTDAP
jgi:LmbE family N-acetylglucosaminyl deacetylase